MSASLQSVEAARTAVSVSDDDRESGPAVGSYDATRAMFQFAARVPTLVGENSVASGAVMESDAVRGHGDFELTPVALLQKYSKKAKDKNTFYQIFYFCSPAKDYVSFNITCASSGEIGAALSFMSDDRSSDDSEWKFANLFPSYRNIFISLAKGTIIIAIGMALERRRSAVNESGDDCKSNGESLVAEESEDVSLDRDEWDVRTVSQAVAKWLGTHGHDSQSYGALEGKIQSSQVFTQRKNDENEAIFFGLIGTLFACLLIACI